MSVGGECWERSGSPSPLLLCRLIFYLLSEDAFSQPRLSKSKPTAPPREEQANFNCAPPPCQPCSERSHKDCSLRPLMRPDMRPQPPPRPFPQPLPAPLPAPPQLQEMRLPGILARVPGAGAALQPLGAGRAAGSQEQDCTRAAGPVTTSLWDLHQFVEPLVHGGGSGPVGLCRGASGWCVGTLPAPLAPAPQLRHRPKSSSARRCMAPVHLWHTEPGPLPKLELGLHHLCWGQAACCVHGLHGAASAQPLTLCSPAPLPGLRPWQSQRGAHMGSAAHRLHL